VAENNQKIANPDTQYPYFILWDISDMDDGNYDLRAVVYDKLGNPAPQPSSIMVSRNHVDFDIAENIEQGWHVKEEKIYKGRSNTVRSGSFRTDKITVVNILEGALNNISDRLKIKTNEEANASSAGIKNKQAAEIPLYGPLAGLASLGEYRDVELESGQASFDSGKELEIIIPYEDADNNGVIDGTNINEIDIQIWSYTSNGPWYKETNFTVDTTSNSIVVKTSHLSLFALYAPSMSENLDNVIAYPSPFRSDMHTEMTFAYLSGNVKIKIYNISGELVFSKENITEPFYTWKVVNNEDEPIASGVYIYVITDDNGNKATNKFAVIK
jgi:hypothetical protein